MPVNFSENDDNVIDPIEEKAKINRIVNSAFSYWIAVTTMKASDCQDFFDWAAGGGTYLPIGGENLSKELIGKLHETFQAQAASDFPTVLRAAQELGGEGGEWNPHSRVLQILDRISSL